MSESDDSQNTRPISVAELLARNGTIGAPPAGGRRRRRRGNADAISVAELTAEIPIIRDEPPVEESEVTEVVEDVRVAEVDEVVVEEAADEVVVDEAADEVVVDEAADEVVVGEAEAGEPVTEISAETVIVYSADEADEIADDETAADETAGDEEEPVDEAAPVDEEAADDEDESAAKPPLSEEPVPTRASGPELSEYPRPIRPSSGAEQMAPDPVDESVDLDELLADQDGDAETLRSYLEASSGTLFGGETIADDIARRGPGTEKVGVASRTQAVTETAEKQPGGFRHVLAAVFQSVLAVIFGAGLFLGFDQLWRWNTIVALVLSVLVILGLVIAVRAVRKTEDIGSTLIAVAVGALVTLGPLALLQST